MKECGLLSFLENFNYKEKYYSLVSIQLTLAFCFLLRIQSIEKISRQSPGELGKSIGLDRIPVVETIRKIIGDVSVDGQSTLWLGNLSKFWMASFPELAGVLYIDGYENPYFGKNNKLPRKYLTRLRLAMRATTDYWVNDKIGQPFFSISKSINPGMIKVIKEEIAPRLEKDIPNQANQEQLSKDKQLHKFMLVFDMEGYSNDFTIDMWEKRIAICTYKKYVKDKWDESEFREYEIEDENGKTEKIKLAERSILIEGKESEKLPRPLQQIRFIETDEEIEVKIGYKHSKKKRQQWIREIRKLTEKEHQISIISSNYKLSIVNIGQYMFARWRQENFFKYMMNNFGIDFIISYLKNDIDDTTELINPLWRKADKNVRSLNTKLQRLQAKFGKITFEGEMQETIIKDYQKKKSQMSEDISIYQLELIELKNNRSEIPKRIKYSKLEDDEKFKAVYNERKHFVDTIKLIVYRAETALANTIIHYMAKPAEARALLQQIFMSDADFFVDNNKKVLEVRIHHLSTKRDTRALNKLCRDLNETETVFPASDLRMVYKLVSK